ncbi:hypothetical protein MAMP_02300 [Methylophaga aminisulfidivorans MP]|uniref:GmrSD restriction endonucleases C-terminal domain-containing protein n=1 Tax=Methylophaga aminisulfidivorans MP TaxID=1026882 RepID=F5SXS6_9GAMM|nr:hypothetical protein MAMP_02300 [Methylophaga aminisulfidivorans MP]
MNSNLRLQIADKKLNFTSIAEIKKKYLFDSKDDGVSRSYIFGYEKDNPSYEYLKTKIFLENSSSSYKNEETIYTHNLELAKSFFIAKLRNLEFDEIERVYTKVTQNFLFNIYAISRDIDVFVAFETMNNRGKELSHLELLKNRLIYLSTKFNVADYEKQILRRLINDSWKSIYHYLGKNKLKPLNDDLFLENHFILYFGNILKDEMDGSRGIRYIQRQYKYYFKDYLLEEKFTAKSINASTDDKNKNLTLIEVKKYAESLKESVETWYQILNPNDSSYSTDEKVWLEKLCRIGIEPVAPLIMVFFQQEKNTQLRIKLLKSLEKFMFFIYLVRYQHFLDVGAYQFLEISAELTTGKLTPEKALESLSERNEKLKKDKNLINIIKDSFKRSGFYNWRGIKYFLYEYDLNLKNESKTNRDKINWDNFIIEDDSDHYTVEHIYPQRPRKECWTKLYNIYSSKEKSVLRHSLGNLLPLSRAKNSSFQNKCFKDKLGSEAVRVGFRYGSYAENEVACKDSWTANDILERGIKLLNFMESRWDINIGETSEKIKFLNLSFVLKKRISPYLDQNKRSKK